jgi:cytochrome c oxidase subunit 2
MIAGSSYLWRVVLRALALPEQASTIAPAIDGLDVFFVAISLGGTGLLGLWTIFAVFRWRRVGPLLPSPRTPGVLVPEVALGASLFALMVVSWIVGFRLYLRLETPPPDALSVFVTAKQWTWEFTYADGTSSMDELVVPLGRPIRLVMTSRDVIHSLFVPAFRLKQDLVPGRTTLLWFEASKAGTWPIECAEFCGFDHSHMSGRVRVLDDVAWSAWKDAAIGRPLTSTDREPLAEQGVRVAAANGCLGCHSADGVDRIGPTFTGMFGREQPLADGSVVHVDEAYLTESMMEPELRIAAGFPNVMPSFRGRLAPSDVAALIEYIRSLRDTPGSVAP